MKLFRIFFVGFFSCLMISSGIAAPIESAEDGIKQVRISILKNIGEIKVALHGRYSIVDPVLNDTIKEGKSFLLIKVIAQQDGLYLGEQLLPTKHIRLFSNRDVTLRYKDKDFRYRGSVDMIWKAPGKLLVVNNVDLERYIKGVLYHEVTNRWPIQAIMAQAVAVRTYTLYQMSVNKAEEFDVTSDIYSQVYGGRNAERYRTNIATNRTRGEVLKYKGKILPAYYSSNCGGHTEDVRQLWKHDLPPLYGVLCEFCRLAPHNHWKKNFKSSDVQALLNNAGFKVGPIVDIEILSRNPSGRIKSLQITSRDNHKIRISGKTFRDIVGPNSIKSNNYEVEMQGYYFNLEGKGWGHGVGFCQWGAHEMSKKGFNYKEILAFYYPSAELEKLEDEAVGF